MLKQIPDIKEIKKIFEILLKVNNSNNVLVAELSKELDVKKSALGAFILDNPFFFETIQDTKGMRISGVFLSEKDNPFTEKWLEAKKERWKNILYIRQWNCYGQLEDFYVSEDIKGITGSNTSYESMTWLWRNTPEKIKRFITTGHFHKSIGSIDTWRGWEIPYALSADEMKALITEGWTLTGTIPDSIKKLQSDEL